MIRQGRSCGERQRPFQKEKVEEEEEKEEKGERREEEGVLKGKKEEL